MKDKISTISLGIRYRRSFRIPEIAGSVIDFVVNSQSPFKSKFFTRTDSLIDNLENKGRVLLAEDDKTTFSIDVDNIILNLATDDFENEIKRLKEEIVPFIKKIFKEFEIRNVERIGIVFQFTEENGGVIEQFVKKITGGTFSEVDRFGMRFTKRDKDLTALVKRDLLDFVNYIVSVSRNDKETSVKFDYQFYYSPEIANIEDVDFNNFIDIAQEKLDSKFLNWYKKDEE